MGNLRQFEANIDKFIKDDVPEKVVAFQRYVTIALLDQFIKRSPVGNPSLWAGPAPAGYVGGRFRSAWTAASGNKSDFAPEAGQSSYAVPNAADVVAKGTSALTPYQSVWISNNVPYAQRLEDGHSGQAPAGVVAVGIASVMGALEV